MKRIFLSFVLFVYVQNMLAQVSGNQAFSNQRNSKNNTYKHEKISSLHLNDSSFIVEAKVLKNVKADTYIAVFGLSQEAKTIGIANNKINNRVDNFIKNIKKLKFEDDDIYTDILTQYRVYDFERKSPNVYNEYVKGFEISKNVIVKYDKPEQIELLLIEAAKDSIFDLIKVDYIIHDVAKVYDELFEKATEVIHKKKQKYVDLTEAKVKPRAQIFGENFVSYYPSDLYKNYEAYTENYYETYSWMRDNETKKLHKFKTFYYDKIDYSGFDKIINPIILEPTIQVVLTLQVKYGIVK